MPSSSRAVAARRQIRISSVAAPPDDRQAGLGQACQRVQQRIDAFPAVELASVHHAAAGGIARRQRVSRGHGSIWHHGDALGRHSELLMKDLGAGAGERKEQVGLLKDTIFEGAGTVCNAPDLGRIKRAVVTRAGREDLVHLVDHRAAGGVGRVWRKTQARRGSRVRIASGAVEGGDVGEAGSAYDQFVMARRLWISSQPKPSTLATDNGTIRRRGCGARP